MPTTIEQLTTHIAGGEPRHSCEPGALTGHQDQTEVARLLALCLRENVSPEMSQEAEKVLHAPLSQPVIDSVIDCWLEGKAGEIARLAIEEKGWRHSTQTQWLKFLNKRNRFDEYFVAELTPVVNHRQMFARLLAHLDGRTAYQVARAGSAAVLCQISEPKAVDAIIDCWLEGKASKTLRQIVIDRHWLQFTESPSFEFIPKLEVISDETVRQVIEERGLRHTHEARWFLYLAATGRFDEYLAEDFEFQTLRPEFLAAPLSLKARIRDAVVKAGEVRMNGLFLAGKLAAELTMADAKALVHINILRQNWQALVENLWWLPARNILDAVQSIIAAQWKPADVNQAALLTRLGELAPLLASEAPKGLCSLPLNPVYQKWLTSGETGPLSQKSPMELKAMIEEEVDPPDQIAALGALQKESQLDAATLAKAGLSEHWMVRWVAVHFGADLTKAMGVNDAGIEWFRRLAMLRNDGDVEALWTAKPCEVTRDGLEALREHLARLPNRRAAGGLLLVEAICTHYTAHDIEVEEGAHVMIEEDSFELEG
jgi:hypothetical protein